MQKRLLKKKLKPIVSLICLWNIDSISFDATIPISNHLHEKPSTVSPLTLFRLDPLLFDYEKTDKEPISEFL